MNIYKTVLPNLGLAKFLKFITNFQEAQGENLLYTCCTQWSVLKDYFEDECRWRAYALMDYGRSFNLQKDTCVIYRVSQFLL